jgi:hypothetical protein
VAKDQLHAGAMAMNAGMDQDLEFPGAFARGSLSVLFVFVLFSFCTPIALFIDLLSSPAAAFLFYFFCFFFPHIVLIRSALVSLFVLPSSLPFLPSFFSFPFFSLPSFLPFFLPFYRLPLSFLFFRHLNFFESKLACIPQRTPPCFSHI